MKSVIVLPTYNEAKNILTVLQEINQQKAFLGGDELMVLVVDDSSSDGTANLVKKAQSSYPNLYLLGGGQKAGLGAAYTRGFNYALTFLKADIVFEMDADLSHDPNLIPVFINEIKKGADVVIGSRYIKGGSIPESWPVLRKLNSKWGNIFARFVAGLNNVQDCTSGYRAISKRILEKINLSKLGVKGYSFQMNLLHAAIKQNATVREIPLNFKDRLYGESKMRLKDIAEFILNAFFLRFPLLKFLLVNLHYFAISFAISSLFFFLLSTGMLSTMTFIYSLLSLFFALLLVQSGFSLYWMLYAWEDIKAIEGDKPPSVLLHPHNSFTAIIPARHEDKVIADTIRAVSGIDYPEDLKEVIVICRNDDLKTIKAAEEITALINKPNIKLVTFNTLPINKAHGLNTALNYATKDTIVVFDAEDQPHKDIFKVVNTVFINKKSAVVQAGVQLMNFRSNWFSTLNVLEYFFWFKSAMHYFSKKGIIPLGGNTVFFKKDLLQKINGWDENCLTEDADIGIRLSIFGAKIDVVYDERIATQEETPTSLGGFIKQRTRWNQGFLQILSKGDYLNLPTFSQRFLAFYILILPELLALLILFLPVSIFMSFTLKLPIVLALLAITPLFLLGLVLITCSIGLYLFCKEFKLKFPFWMPLKIILTAYPFFIILGISSFRAIFRSISGNGLWEKTAHINAHRKLDLGELNV